MYENKARPVVGAAPTRTLPAPGKFCGPHIVQGPKPFPPPALLPSPTSLC